MSSGWGKGGTRQWRRVRAQILARDGFVCRVQLAGCTVTADCVHHVVGRAVSGDDPRFLVASCTSCNLKIGNPQRQARKGRRRTPQRREVNASIPRPVTTTYDRW